MRWLFSLSVALAAVAQCMFRVEAQKMSWADSYSIGGKCYCDTSFDHNIGPLMVPGTSMTVREACAAAGKGPESIGKEKRVYYNDVQCGNGPANDYGDEDWCPGRVDLGDNNKSGCMTKGPKFSFNKSEEDVDKEQPEGTVVFELECLNFLVSTDLWIHNDTVTKGLICICLHCQVTL